MLNINYETNMSSLVSFEMQDSHLLFHLLIDLINKGSIIIINSRIISLLNIPSFTSCKYCCANLNSNNFYILCTLLTVSLSLFALNLPRIKLKVSNALYDILVTYVLSYSLQQNVPICFWMIWVKTARFEWGVCQ